MGAIIKALLKAGVKSKKANTEAQLINLIARYRKDIAKPGKAFQKVPMSKSAMRDRLEIAEQHLKAIKGSGTLVKKDFAKSAVSKTGKAKGPVRKDFGSTLGRPKQATKSKDNRRKIVSKIKQEGATYRAKLDK